MCECELQQLLLFSSPTPAHTPRQLVSRSITTSCRFRHVSSWYVVRALSPLSSDAEEHGGGRLGSLSLASVGHATPAQWEHILLPRSNRGSTSNRTAHAQHFPRSPASCTRLSSRRSPLWSRRGRRAGAVYSDTPVLLSHSDNSMRLMRLFFKGRSALVRETSRERG